MTDLNSAPRPWAVTGGRSGSLRRDGVPTLLLGGQVFNSSSSSPRSITEAFAHVRRMNGNVVLAPVSWALTEPREGTFDFTLIDRMLEEARDNGLRLVLLWFGEFKNAGSTYAPTWVRADRRRFPRAVIEPKGLQAFSYEGATAKPVLSVFGSALREADATAFEALVRHLVQADPAGTVAMIQVENESGILSDSRDRGPLAEAAWNAPVPEDLLVHVRSATEASLARSLWTEHGSKEAGTWPDLFGESSASDEVFMAWAFASYVEHLAARGKAIADIPMYANAWLGPQPGQAEPGQYPSGGPASRVLDVWRVAAPSLALLGPDIYIDDAESAMREYAAGSQPLFVPESRLSAAELVRAIGTYRAIGWSGFGLDGANPEGQVATTLKFLVALEAQIAAAQADDRVGAVVLEPDVELHELRIDEIDIAARGTLALFQRMLLDAGVSIPDPQLNLPDETAPGAPVPHPGDSRPFGLLVSESEGSILVIGQGLTLDFFAPDGRIEIDAVEELLVDERRVITGRVLNGDERLRVLPTDRVGAARIRLLRLPAND
ncbi:DUF5597 domain-containing protein [Agromyces bracchium]|uniref:Glycoside hydrolase n=1 Tax=Agromyces bracchium TaxID=88376 RepID=A0A6I3MI70_9MICO|nr:DUF5597 domain-containing protein [Agromyces bracchium]MTH70023.1 glycoside hydrolase [Agromyces bracchium]